MISGYQNISAMLQFALQMTGIYSYFFAFQKRVTCN